MESDESLHTGAGAEPRSQTSRPHRILVVDDDPTVRELSSAILVRSGYRVDAAEDGAAGWTALQSGKYDLLITDNNMPKVTGIELVRNLRSACMALPVILASGQIPDEDLIKEPALQVAATLPKPFTGDQLLGTVDKVLQATDSSHAPLVSPPVSENQLTLDPLWP